MRKTLLTSAAILGATGGLAVAQNAPNPLQGQYIAPLLGGPSAQNIVNSWAAAIPGGGLAATYLGVTANVDVTHGRTNGSNALDPTGGAPEAAQLFGLSYAYGLWSVGADTVIEDSQGSAELTHTSQRHQFALAVGGAYRIAPGINLCLEYTYEQQHQGRSTSTPARPASRPVTTSTARV